MKNALKIVFASALITAAAIKAAPALSEPVTPAASVVVKTSDLNLASAAGQRQLDIRLGRAAREVCGEASAADLSGKNAVRECRNAVLATARGEAARIAAAGNADAIRVASR